MSHLTRRGFLRSSGLAAAGLGLRPWSGRAASAKAAVLTRYSVQSPQGKKMLVILADAVTKMRARAQSDPRSWVFQWYTHLVAGPGSTAEEFNINKQNELQRVFPNAHGPNRKLAEAMWNTCEPHVNADMGDFFLPWHRMYVFYFEQIVREVSGAAQFTLPYWDYNDPSQRSLPVEFRRPGDPVWGPLFFGHRWPRINAGKPIDEPPTAGPVTLNAMKIAFYKDIDVGGETIIPGFCSTVQSDPHKQVHWSVGDLKGMMSFPYTANDPVFWVHHCTIDRLWASWNKAGGRNPNRNAFLEQAYTFVNGEGRMVRPKVADVLETSGLGYVYDTYVPRPDDSAGFSEGGALTFTPHAASAKDAGRIRLRPTALTINLVPETSPPGGAGPGSFSARMQGVKERGALHLLLEDLSADANPVTAFEVYLTGGGRGRYSRNDPTFLGAIEFMEAGHHHAGHGRPRKGRNHVFVVSAALHKLLAGPAVDAPVVTLVPTGPFAPRSAPTIGRIVLGSLAKKP